MFVSVARLESDHKKFLEAHARAMNEVAQKAAESGKNYSQTRQGFIHRTGRAKRLTSGKVLKRGGNAVGVRMSNSAKYAAILEKGSRAHTISTRTYTFLHPGTRAYTFLSRGRDHAFKVFGEDVTVRMTRLASKFNQR